MNATAEVLIIHKSHAAYAFGTTAPSKANFCSHRIFNVLAMLLARNANTPLSEIQAYSFAHCLLNALQTRVQELLQPAQAQRGSGPDAYGRRQLKLHELRCVQPQVPGEDQAPHPSAKHGRPPTSSARPGTHTELIGRFHATRKLSENMQGDTLPFMLEASARRAAAQKAYDLFDIPLPPPPRTHPEASSPGSGTGNPLMALRLGNRSNYCYANSLVALMFVGLPSHNIFSAQLAALLDRLIISPGRHLWDDLIWRSLLAQWRRPSQQNDVAEFATHPFSRRITCHPTFTGQWQAGLQGDERFIRDTASTDHCRVLSTAQRVWHQRANRPLL